MKVSWGQKRPQFDDSENEKSQRFIDYESDRYISLPPTLPQRESNCPSNLGEGTRSLIHLVNISKNQYYEKSSLALEFPDRRGTIATKDQANSSYRKTQQLPEGGFGTPVSFLSFYNQAQPTQRGVEEPIDLFCSYHQPSLLSKRRIGNSAGFYSTHLFDHWLQHLWCHRLKHSTFWNGLLSMAWTLSLFGKQRLNTGCTQSVQIYLGGGCIHSFDRQKASGAGYMAGNS